MYMPSLEIFSTPRNLSLKTESSTPKDFIAISVEYVSGSTRCWRITVSTRDQETTVLNILPWSYLELRSTTMNLVNTLVKGKIIPQSHAQSFIDTMRTMLTALGSSLSYSNLSLLAQDSESFTIFSLQLPMN